MTIGLDVINKKINRSKRLRKKLFLEEFSTYGFELECEFKKDLTEEVISQFVENFFIEAIYSKGLTFGGGLSSKRLCGFVGSSKRYGSASETDKENLYTWLKGQTEIATIDIGELRDANYCD